MAKTSKRVTLSGKSLAAAEKHFGAEKAKGVWVVTKRTTKPEPCLGIVPEGATTPFVWIDPADAVEAA